MATNVLNQAAIDALKTAMQARFDKGLAQGTQDWMKIAQKLSSNSASNTYGWISQFPAFREWVGSRLHKSVKERAYQVSNRKFEATLDVPREALEDDNYGMYADLAYSYGISVDDLMNDLIYSGVTAGFSSICYDGQFFFDTDHPVYPNEDGTGVAATVSNMQAGAGEPWVLLCTKRAPKAFYLQERVKPEFIAKNSAVNSDGVFENDVFSFGGRWRGEAVYGFWQLAYGSKATLDETNFNANYKAMMKVKGDGNRKLGIVADTLLVGPDNLAAAETLIKAINKANGASNTNYSKVELIVTPWLAL
ncbi:Mu-like prophage major head subunit gpT family protein [Methylomonas sp. MV1]|uniref:Mu-like prophage major head subunit gpT family protein n=1 Tax=Methylomonas sp. MV1 TaxID=3073620 RepID=UPI0028A35887|nr:Mu-like prophage major head subunit gpT family protein [Methylomonas sp. MV1]MDT4329769.1 Mu-like prophage major head subunit gpT family protein [Methylomonas sp. MV1]